MSLRWTSYVAPKPPKGLKNAKPLRVKSHFAWRKSATKFLCVKTVSDKVVRHSSVYLSVQKWLVGSSPSTWTFGGYWPTPLRNAEFQSIFVHSTSAITPSKKVQLALTESQLRAFHCTSVRRLAVAKRLCDCSFSVFTRSASAVTASEKVQLTLLGSPLCAFQ